MEPEKYTAEPATNIYKSFIPGAPDLKSSAPQSSKTDPTKFLPFEIKHIIRNVAGYNSANEPDFILYAISGAFTSISPSVKEELRETSSFEESERILDNRSHDVCLSFKSTILHMAGGLTAFFKEYEKSLGPHEAMALMNIEHFAKVEWPTAALDQWTKAFSNNCEVDSAVEFEFPDHEFEGLPLRRRTEVWTTAEITPGRIMRVIYREDPDAGLSRPEKLGFPNFTLSIQRSEQDKNIAKVIVAFEPGPLNPRKTVRDVLIKSIATAVNDPSNLSNEDAKTRTLYHLRYDNRDEFDIDDTLEEVFQVTSTKLSKSVTVEFLRSKLHYKSSLAPL